MIHTVNPIQLHTASRQPRRRTQRPPPKWSRRPAISRGAIKAGQALRLAGKLLAVAPSILRHRRHVATKKPSAASSPTSGNTAPGCCGLLVVCFWLWLFLSFFFCCCLVLLFCLLFCFFWCWFC